MDEPAPIQPTTPTAGDRAPTRFALVGTAIFAAVVCAGLWRHELWRDEAKAWLISRDSTSLLDAFHNRRYEGHPFLWYAMLYVASRVTRDPIAMQVVHGLTATAAAFTFLRFAPLGRWTRALFVAGVFPLYTYAVISRNYAVGLLLLFAMLALFAAPRRRPILAATLAALLASASIYGLFLAGAYAVAWGVRDVSERVGSGWARRAIAAAVVLAGLGFGAVQVVPPAADRARVATLADYRPRGVGVAGSLARLWSPLLPVPQTDRVVNLLARRVGNGGHATSRPAWQATLARGVPRSARAATAVAFLAVLLFALRRSPPAVAFLVASLAAMIAFEALFYDATDRHLGHRYVAIVGAIWLWRVTTGRPLARGARAAIAAVLALHAVVGVGYVAVDLVQPYSSSRSTAALLAARYGRDFDLIFEPADYGSSVAAYLDVPIYFPTHRRWATFELRDGTPKVATPEELRAAIDLVLGRATRPVVLVIDGPAPAIPGVELVRIGSHQTSISREAWDVYELRRLSSSTAPAAVR